ncbi:MAG: 50S ribosomal protein L13 [Chloroflexi bacterium]|nr:50S ribosomal protein L13 [Chloroflexota bacterium]
MIVKKTFYPKPDDVSHDWVLVDAKDQNLGRLASQIASLILGKHKPTFTPGVNMGDFVVVVNAEHVVVTGKKLDQKIYFRNTGYPSGLRQITLRDQLATKPERVIEHAVKGMLPHNRLGRRLRKKLKVYAGPEHPHQAQKPKPIDEVLP